MNAAINKVPGTVKTLTVPGNFVANGLVNKLPSWAGYYCTTISPFKLGLSRSKYWKVPGCKKVQS
jgi:hypothetical protein